VDSTRLKVYGRDEWHQKKHDVAARRTWRKLHVAIDEHHQILACGLTARVAGDTTAVPHLLCQITRLFDSFMGDGAYDGDPVAMAVLAEQPNAQVVTPPYKGAVFSTATTTWPDRHIETIAQKGRAAWQQITGYNPRSYVELAMQRYERIFGNTMKTRVLVRQKTEALDQYVCTEQNDRSRHGGIDKSLKVTDNRSLFGTVKLPPLVAPR
jgi:hypothetical protein